MIEIFILNSGSSSIKCSVFEFSNRNSSRKLYEEIDWENTREFDRKQIEKRLKKLLNPFSISAIGHRVVHGGGQFNECTRIDATVKESIRSFAPLAPLHNGADIAGIEMMERLFPSVPQFAVFDTAFHASLPKEAYIYPGPYEWLEMGIRRFGFHGTSFSYCAQRAAELLGRMPEKMAICHLGSGASICALKNGQSIDTTMGLTPLEGLMMDTRCGSIDPGILLYLLREKQMNAEELSIELNQRSGLLGISGLSSDMKVILQQAAKGHDRAELALNLYIHNLIRSLGAMIGSLGGLDALVFTGGIGENAALIRKKVCERLSFLGLELQETIPDKEGLLSSSKSKVLTLLIHTEESLEIARQCWNKLNPR